MHIPAYSNLSLVRWPGNSEDEQIALGLTLRVVFFLRACAVKKKKKEP